MTLKFAVFALLLFVYAPLCSRAQTQAEVFEQFKKDPTVSVLPDFSYAGYHHGEKELPKPSLKVFDVTLFGAVPDDSVSDRAAIEAAVKAANMNGSGIIWFPPGRFLVNEDTDRQEKITITGSHIVFRGSGPEAGGTEIFMKNSLPPADPEQMWSCPPMFDFTSNKKDKLLGEITGKARARTFDIRVSNTAGIEPGDWIMLRMLSNRPALIQSELGEYLPDPAWSSLVNKGVFIKVVHQVRSVENNYITLAEPLTYPVEPRDKWQVYLFGHDTEVGIEDIAFTGNWKKKFVHHRSWEDDSGWTLLRLSRLTNSWIRNCRFTDVNVGATIHTGAGISVWNCRITGNGGHEAITNTGGTNIFFGKNTDEASMWHSVGTNALSMNTVLWRVTYPSSTSFESHSSQPRNTLLDCTEGGLYYNRAGGAVQNMPNHMQNLILWNYRQTGEAYNGFDFWPADRRYFKIPYPVIVGFHGASTTFKPERLKYSESLGRPVEPESLYEAQLKLRLKKLPDWVVRLKESF